MVGFCGSPYKIFLYSFSGDRIFKLWSRFSMTISLTYTRNRDLVGLCDFILRKYRVTIQEVAKILGKVSSSLIALLLGRLHFRVLERCQTKALKENNGNFDEFTEISDTHKTDITWWRNNILTTSFPIL